MMCEITLVCSSSYMADIHENCEKVTVTLHTKVVINNKVTFKLKYTDCVMFSTLFYFYMKISMYTKNSEIYSCSRVNTLLVNHIFD